MNHIRNKLFLKKKLEERCNYDNINDVNLQKIKIISKNIYNDNIKKNMISYIKDNNCNVEYDKWLKQFSIEDYNNEFVNKIRNNDIYHKIWNDIRNFNEFEIIY